MRIQVHYTSQIEAALGTGEELVTLADGSCLADLLAILAERHGAPLHQCMLDSHGQLRPSVLICIDQQHVPPHDNPPLRDGATVTFLAAVSGG